MSLDIRYVTAPSLQQYFVDKDTGLPLSGGIVSFFSDVNRTEYKTVYQLQGNQANYTYEPLPNPIILSSVGTIQDNNGNDVIPYFLPIDEVTGEPELYYIVVQNSLGVPQFTRQAWPNPVSSSGGSTTEGVFNFVPNGQLLSHVDVIDNTLVGGENTIAHGGVSIVLPDNVLSENKLEYIASPNANNTPSSPRYIAKWISTNASAADNIKNIRIKWRDVNKFSSAEDPSFTFGFWASSNVSIPFSLNVSKNYGTNGNPPERFSVGVGTISPSPQFYSFVFQFGQNVGKEVDVVNNDDFVALEIDVAKNIGFEFEFTDFVLVEGAVELVGFPKQTNGDMFSRSIAGWVETPDVTGKDLYLPMILTREGMKFDDSMVGKIFADSSIPADPNGPDAVTNEMFCDGSTYSNSDFSSIGIPYSRLGEKLISASAIPDYPVYGTGAEYASSIVMNTTDFLLSVNSPGTPVSAAVNVSTPFTFENFVIYNGSSTGAASHNYVSSWNRSNRVVAISENFATPLAVPSAGTSGFTVTDVASQYETQNITAFYVDTIAASFLENPGLQARYFDFSNETTTYRVYFVITTETPPPTPPSGELIQVNVESNFGAEEVAASVNIAIASLQATKIRVDALPTQNLTPQIADYFTFQTNPAVLRNFYVWYQYGPNDQDPGLTSKGIRVDLLTTDTPADVLTKTNAAINAEEFGIPDLRGMFLRGNDPEQTWDADAQNRLGFSQASGIGVGSYQYQQFLSHLHEAESNTIVQPVIQVGNIGTASFALRQGPTASSIPTTIPTLSQTTTTLEESGGAETRPVNAYVNWVIKY